MGCGASAAKGPVVAAAPAPVQEEEDEAFLHLYVPLIDEADELAAAFVPPPAAPESRSSISIPGRGGATPISSAIYLDRLDGPPAVESTARGASSAAEDAAAALRAAAQGPGRHAVQLAWLLDFVASRLPFTEPSMPSWCVAVLAITVNFWLCIVQIRRICVFCETKRSQYAASQLPQTATVPAQPHAHSRIVVP
jgi:hypothetical protein